MHPSAMNKRNGWILLAALCAVASVATAQQESSAAFSASERRALMAGELVRRNVVRREGRNRLFGGTSWMRVRAPLDEVWSTISAPSAFPRLIPSLDRVRVVEDNDGERVMWMHHSYAISETEYYIVMRTDPERHEIRFELDRSRPHGSLRAGRGFLSLSSYRGGTIVSWGMLADVGAGMVQQVFGPFLNDWLLKPPRCIRDEVEPGRVNEC